MKKNYTQLIIFGATGDLASLKLYPAIFELYEQKLLPENFQLIGFGRTKMKKEEFQKIFKKSVLHKYSYAEESIGKLMEQVEYFSGNYDEQSSFEEFSEFCLDIAKGQEIEQIAYFSVPPTVFESLVINLANTLKKDASSIKIVIEKPFGIDEKSAEHLFRIISEYFEEKEVYLLDHFLGKRPIQSIHKLRLENNVINLMIRPEEIANIQITAMERVEVGKRVGYYDQVGAMKDMLQSHLLQILALITMDIPLNPSIDALQREKQNILSAVKFSGSPADVVFGQYDSYSRLEGVAKNTQTDTLVALKLSIDRREWFDTPIYFRTGKKLDQSLTKVVIEFKKMSAQDKKQEANKLIFEIKPMEKVGLKLIQEKPTLNGTQTEELSLEQNLTCSSGFCLDDYASLFFDIIRGHKQFFLSYPEIVAAWKVVDSVENLKNSGKAKLYKYEDSSAGPKQFLNFPEADGFKWN
jgi:glucose-6-phosphate 1-dehydrogenase